MLERAEFFKLTAWDQASLRVLVAATSTVQLVQVFFMPELWKPDAWLALTFVGIGLNVILLYFSIFITSAPNLFFQVIPWVFVWIVICDFSGIFFAARDETLLTAKDLPSIFKVVLSLALVRSVLRFWRAVTKAKSDRLTKNE